MFAKMPKYRPTPAIAPSINNDDITGLACILSNSIVKFVLTKSMPSTKYSLNISPIVNVIKENKCHDC